VASAVAYVDADADAPTARAHLLQSPYDWLVTNIRLREYNGLHLVYLAQSASPTRAIVYADAVDLALAREAQGIEAFYEPRHSIVDSLAAYLQASLPPHDRRDAARHDRRVVFRGGRRCTDRLAVSEFKKVIPPPNVR
jgi:hypothetical protein